MSRWPSNITAGLLSDSGADSYTAQPIFNLNVFTPNLLFQPETSSAMVGFPPFTPFATANVMDTYHKISGALFAPGCFHQFILATILERAVLPMQPLNWQFGVRADRPFDVLPGQNARNPIPKWPTRPCDHPKYPTAYYLEQLQFWEDGPLPEEDESAAEMPTRAPLKVWFDSTLEFFLFIFAVVRSVVQMLCEVAALVLSLGKKMWNRIVDGRTWEFAASVLVATQIVRILPRMEGSLGSGGGGGAGWSTSSAPLYVIMIPNPDQWSRLSTDVRGSRQLLTIHSQRSCALWMMNLVRVETIWISVLWHFGGWARTLLVRLICYIPGADLLDSFLIPKYDRLNTEWTYLCTISSGRKLFRDWPTVVRIKETVL
jgi:hypothetical protein